MKAFCGSANHKKFLLWTRFFKIKPAFYYNKKFLLQIEKIAKIKKIKPFNREVYHKTKNFAKLSSSRLVQPSSAELRLSLILVISTLPNSPTHLNLPGILWYRLKLAIYSW